MFLQISGEDVIIIVLLLIYMYLCNTRWGLIFLFSALDQQQKFSHKHPDEQLIFTVCDCKDIYFTYMY